MEIVVLANIINGIGALLSIAGMSIISLSESKNGFLITAFSCLFFMIGSYMLESYPILILDLLFFIISLNGLVNKNIDNNYLNKLLLYTIYLSITIGLIAFSLGEWNVSAWQTTIIYISTYALLANNKISKRKYLFLDLIAFLLMIPHLYLYQQYAILFDESISAIIAIIGLLKIYIVAKRALTN